MMGRGFGYWCNGMTGGDWFSGVLFLLFGALVLVGIVLLVIWVVKASSSHSPGGGGSQPPGATDHDEAIGIAKRRLASGEITKEQYDEIMRALGG